MSLRRMVRPLGWLALCCTLLSTGELFAQPGGGEPVIKQGRVLEVQVKGKTRTLVIETTEGDKFEIRVTPTFDFSIVGQGDAGFVRPGVFISSKGVQTQDKIFLTSLDVYVLPKGKRPPAGRVEKADAMKGDSLNVYNVSGEVTSVGPAEGYPDFTALGLKLTGRAPQVWLEQGYQVKVYITDAERVTAGADAEVALKPLRGGKFTPVAVRVYHEGAFDSAAVFGDKADK